MLRYYTDQDVTLYAQALGAADTHADKAGGTYDWTRLGNTGASKLKKEDTQTTC